MYTNFMINPFVYIETETKQLVDNNFDTTYNLTKELIAKEIVNKLPKLLNIDLKHLTNKDTLLIESNVKMNYPEQIQKEKQFTKINTKLLNTTLQHFKTLHITINNKVVHIQWPKQ